MMFVSRSGCCDERIMVGELTYIYIYIHIRIRELLFEVFFYGWGVPLLVELEIRYWPDFFGEKKLLGASWG